MEKTFIKDIEQELKSATNVIKPVKDVFLVREKQNGKTKAGKPYIALVLCDKTGSAKGRVWDRAEELSARFGQGDLVEINAHPVEYQGSLQLNVRDINKHTGETDISAFLPASAKNPEACFKELMEISETINDKYLRELVFKVFEDDAIAKAFKKAPAAKSVHHCYIGGLIEHTLSLARIAEGVADFYKKEINRDLLITGCLLHDIGKIYELNYETNFDYTDVGRLMGHIVVGVEIINEKLKLIDNFPEDTAFAVKHMILSHHGEYEFGSPKRPKTIEALTLHFLDNLDAKISGVTDFMKEHSSDSKWTGYYKFMERYFYTDTFNRIEEDDSI